MTPYVARGATAVGACARTGPRSRSGRPCAVEPATLRWLAGPRTDQMLNWVCFRVLYALEGACNVKIENASERENLNHTYDWTLQ